MLSFVIRGRKWNISWQGLVLLLVVALGTFLRFWQLGSGGLIHDETILMDYIIRTNGRYPSTSPLLYLLILRGLTFVAGDSEFVFRSVSALAGSLSIPLLYALARRLRFDRTTALFCSIILAFAPAALSFSRFAHHYSIEMCVCVALPLLVERYTQGTRLRDYIVLLVSALLSLGLAQTAIFLMPSLAGCLFLLWYRTRRPQDLRRFVLLSGIIGVSFCLYYFLVLSQVVTSGNYNFWRDFFLNPWPPFAFLSVVGSRLYDFFPLFFRWWPDWSVMTMACFALLGAVLWCRKYPRGFCLYILLPFLVTIGVAVVHIYPFGQRPDLFLLPLFALCVGYGMGGVVRWSLTLSVLGVLTLFGMAFWPAVAQMPINARFIVPGDIRGAMDYYSSHRLPSDQIVLIGKWQKMQYLYYGDEEDLFYGGNMKDLVQSCGGDVNGNAEKIHCIATRAEGRLWWFWSRDAGQKRPGTDSLQTASSLIQKDCHIADVRQFTNAFLILSDSCSQGRQASNLQSSPNPAASSVRSK